MSNKMFGRLSNERTNKFLFLKKSNERTNTTEEWKLIKQGMSTLENDPVILSKIFLIKSSQKGNPKNSLPWKSRPLFSWFFFAVNFEHSIHVKWSPSAQFLKIREEIEEMKKGLSNKSVCVSLSLSCKFHVLCQNDNNLDS